MRFEHFTIRNYRAITGPLSIDITRKPLSPIIGINEAGKTTVLQALFAFDHFNDDLNGGRHLQDTSNLYRTNPGTATVEARIQCSRRELQGVLSQLDKDKPEHKGVFSAWRRKRELPQHLTITRDLKSRKYSIAESPFASHGLQNEVAEEVFATLPYILYFDDFRDKVDERILIPADSDTVLTGWSAIIEQLFGQADKGLSIFDLAGMEERQRKSTLAKVQRYLNKTLTKEWQNFRLDDTEALEIGLEFEPSKTADSSGQLKLEVVETDSAGDNHFFFISDRSKGFYWFFNFVMKLEFNPKVVTESDQGSIYLLDEPGSYLHATAQTKLCEKLKFLSENNTVIYCTHSHYLLNPEVIPLSTILVADKDGSGSVSLVPIYMHEGSILERRSAFQPVIDALQIKPFLLDLNHSRAIIVEGIYDYYALELFRQQRPISVLPSVGADSVKFYVSLLIAWQVKFRALWDNDKAGRMAFEDASEIFGDDIANSSFRLLPPSNNGAAQILQDMFDGADLTMIRKTLDIGPQASFEKTIASLFFSPRRNELLNQIGNRTRQRFGSLWESLAEGL